MSDLDSLQPCGEKIKNALIWLSESLKTSPEKSRAALLREAEIRFDLSPAECDFLDRKFTTAPECPD